MARFLDIKSLQKFVFLRASIHNRFKLDHHFTLCPSSGRTVPPRWSSGINRRPENLAFEAFYDCLVSD
jgi:hypothetical protein